MPVKRPALLTTVAIIAIVLGSLGILSSLTSVAGSILTEQLASGWQGRVQMPEQMGELNEMAERFRVPGMALGVLRLLVSIMLVAGGTMALSGKLAAVGVLAGTAIAAIIVDTATTVMSTVMSSRIMGSMQESMFTAGRDMPPGFDSMMSTAMYASLGAGIVWLLCKLAFYILTIITMKRPVTKEWLTGETGT